MLRTRTIGIAGAVLVMLAAVSFAVTFSDSYRDCKETRADNYTQENNPDIYEKTATLFVCEGVSVDRNGELITALATVFLAVITFLLVGLGREQSDTNKAQLRAYMSAITKGITVAADGETVSIYVQLTNSGQTPAFNLIVPCGIIVLPPDDRFSVRDIKLTKQDAEKLPVTTLPKDASCVIHAATRITYADAVAYLASPRRIYVYGRMTYQDVFGLPQWAEFCHYLDWPKFQAFLSAALNSGPDQKTNLSFKVAEFGQDTSFGPRHSPA